MHGVLTAVCLLRWQALNAAQQAIRKFEAAGTPWQRPPDYYAEMVKSDEHMAKVKQQLMHEQEQMEAVEQRCALLPSYKLRFLSFLSNLVAQLH